MQPKYVPSLAAPALPVLLKQQGGKVLATEGGREEGHLRWGKNTVGRGDPNSYLLV